MNRRQFLTLLASGVIGHALDVDKLLWVPDQKKIFIPSPTFKPLSYAEILAVEFERVIPHIRTLFEKDDLFYRTIISKDVSRYK